MDRSNYNWGVVGNCRSAAIIDNRGDVIWLCLPDFDSASLFAAMLDAEKGGRFGFRLTGAWDIQQHYRPRTNILVTRFENKERAPGAPRDIFEVHDFMPRYRHAGKGNEYFTPPELIRYVRHISGRPTFSVHFAPALDYARSETAFEKHKTYIKAISTSGSYESAYLYSSFDFDDILDGRPIALESDGFLELSYHQKLHPQRIERIYLKMQKTEVYWLDWVDRNGETAHYNDAVIRSALVLKLMVYQPTGAVLAAVTTSLPETIGEPRNWDYRFCWIRDASMTIAVFTDLNHAQTMRRYISYILGLLSTKESKIQIMYGIRSEKELEEKVLEHLAGYLDSRPVRVGNAAYTQPQNDVYGVLLDVLFKSLKYLNLKLDENEELWTIVRMLVRTVLERWREPDSGIWEFRGTRQHFVYSKVMCWVAVDRGVRIAERLGMSHYVNAWRVQRDIIHDDVLQHGWNAQIGAFSQYYGAPHLDAANLLMEYYGFIDAQDPRFVSTVMRSREQLCHKGLMYRYKTADDFGYPSSAFTVCTFWLIYALHRIGMPDDALALFEKVLSYRNGLGLLSEDICFDTGRQLGNFPQAYSHLALITCARLFSQDQDGEVPPLL